MMFISVYIVWSTHSSDINRKLEFPITQLFISAHRCILGILINRGSTMQYYFVFITSILTHGVITVSIHCAPEMSEIDCIGRIERFWPKFVRGW